LTSHLNSDKILQLHLNKFKETCNFHYNTFNCTNVTMNSETKLTDVELEKIINERESLISSMFKYRMKPLENLSLDEILEIYKIILNK